jgi:hypothetical protein
LMPHQSLLYAGRVHACANLPQIRAREPDRTDCRLVR